MRSLAPVLRRALLAAVAVPALACGGSIASTEDLFADAAPPDDGSAEPDARVSDASRPDAARPDAASPDAALPDAGCTTVTAPPDAGGCGSYDLQLANEAACDFSGAGNSGSIDECTRLCGNNYSYCYAPPERPGYVRCSQGCAGRRPAGLDDARAAGESAVGRFFADMARLEAASVDAFRILRRELAHYKAPRALLRAASHAARDEVRHARTTRALARAHGASPAPHAAARAEVRALEEIARENAVEGCVRETFGALLAHHQAERAADPRVRAAMRKIARDETRHAELAWAVARWIEPRLSRAARARVRRARDEAARELACAFTASLDARVARDAGLPAPDGARRMIDALGAELWAA